MELAQDLLDILVCPESKKPLVYFARGESGEDESQAFLYCPASRLKYQIDDGIPVMLIEDAEKLSSTAGDALEARACELGLTA